MTALFRVEERSVPYSIASVATSSSRRRARVSSPLDLGAIGLVVGNFTGTLTSTSCSSPTARPARAGVPPGAVPRHATVRDAARPLGARAVGDRVGRSLVRRVVQRRRGGRRLLGGDQGRLDHGVPHGRVPYRVALVCVLDRGRREARRTYAFVLTYLLASDRGSRWARGAGPVARRLLTSRPGTSAPRRGSRCSRSRPPPTPATRCSRSAAGGPGGRSATGSSPGSGRRSTWR